MMQPFTTLLASLFVGIASVSVLHAEPLITAAEAALPAPPDAGLTMRGLTRGPAIELEAPQEAKPAKSPMLFKVRFTGRNNAAIEKDSVKVTYVKAPSVDLTRRLRPHLTDSGIEMSGAEIPAGTHVLRIDVKDTQGRSSTAVVKLVVSE
jgi:hypothetical protein